MNPNIKKFLQPLQDCEFGLNQILDDLCTDPWVVPTDERPQRATGAALNVALSLLEAARLPGARIVSFLAGAASAGPGQVVDIKLEYTIRTFFDL